MITLDAGNVLLKPTHRKQLMARLKRAIRIGDRIGDFVMKITMRRTGRHVEMTAKVHDRFGNFDLRTRGTTWTDAFRTIVRDIFRQLHNHALRRAAFTAT
ncbi:MAG: hypothetical protein H7144_00985 [Burkholderiales bacterium]|nr:hypothetical protein [Phycisphaerae bacterium]